MITTYYSINDLHQATRTGLRAEWTDFHIMQNESTSVHMVSKMNAHICDFHHICLDIESDYALGMDSLKQQTQNNSIYFVPKGTVISWTSDHSNLWKGYTIFFKSNFISTDSLGSSDSLLYALKPVLFDLDQESSTQLIHFCKQMMMEQLRNDRESKEIIKCWLKLFLKYSHRFFDFSKHLELSYEMQIKYKFKELLDFNINQERSVSFYANTLNISPRHFSRLIKNVTGISPKQMILQKLIEVAKTQLSNSNRSISQIAYDLGFSNIPQFTKVFKESTGLSPSTFRRTHL